MTTAQCSNCFFGQTTLVVAGQTSRVCRNRAPYPIDTNNGPPIVSGTVRVLWAPVQDTDWCGDGADNATGVSYSSSVQQLPVQYNGVRAGTFTLTAAITTTVTETRVDAQTTISFWASNQAAAQLIGGQGGWSGATGPSGLYVSTQTPGASFVVTVANGHVAAGTETFGYILIG